METEETLQSETIENNGEKLFSQEEVNKIISARLKRYKALEGDQEQAIEEAVNQRIESAMASRVADLDARELRLNCREYVQNSGYPLEMLDAISAVDLEDFKAKADSIYNAVALAASPAYPEIRDAGEFANNYPPKASLRVNTQHVPKAPRVF